MSNYHKFTKIDRVLKTTAKNYKLESVAQKHKILKAWAKTAEAFVSQAAEESKAVDFNKGVLLVACLSREVAYQIKVLASRIIYALNMLLGKTAVFAIQVEY